MPFEFKADEGSPCPLLDENLARIAYTLNPEVDADYILGIIGPERSGKSNLATYACQRVGQYLSRPFTSKEIFYGGHDFLEHGRQVEEAQAIMIDEGVEAFNARDWNKEPNRELMEAFMEIGYKHLFAVLIIPDFNSFDTYLRNHRLIALLQTEMIYDYSTGHYIRGIFRVYNQTKIPFIKKTAEGRLRFPQPTFTEFCPSMRDSQLWKDYKIAEKPRKDALLKEKTDSQKGKNKYGDKPEFQFKRGPSPVFNTQL